MENDFYTRCCLNVFCFKRYSLLKLFKLKTCLFIFILSFITFSVISSATLIISNGKSTFPLSFSINVVQDNIHRVENKDLIINNFSSEKVDWGNKLIIKHLSIFTILDQKLISRDTSILTDRVNILNTLRNPFISVNTDSSYFIKLVNLLILSISLSIVINLVLVCISRVLVKITAFRGDLPPINTNNHLLALNFFRFIAAVLVVIYHMAPSSWHQKYWITNLGSEMVTFFFVLSGFVMVISHYNKNSESIISFYSLRFARIYPIYLVVLLLLINHDTQLFDIFLNVFLLQAFVPGHSIAINVPGWSLSAEWLFYILFPFLLICYRKNSIVLNSCLLISAFGLVYCLFNFWFKSFEENNLVYNELLNCFPLVHLCSFVLGNYIGVVYLKAQNITLSKLVSNFLSIMVLVWVIYDLKNGYSKRFYLLDNLAWSSIVYSFSFAALVFSFAVCKNSILSNMLRNKYCIRLGDISYSIYLLQSLAYGKLINQLLLLSSSDLIKVFVPLVILIGISYFSYIYIEVPGKKLLTKGM